jgi:hypothetical protein
VFREALTYPVRGETAEESLLVGVALALATGLLVRLGVLAVLAVAPLVLLSGYALAVLRESAESNRGESGVDAPPGFADLRELAADGVRAVVVTVGYLFVPVVALVITVCGAAGGAGGRPATPGTSALLLGGGTVVLVVSLAFAYLLPAGLVAVARTGRLRSAVAPVRFRRTMTNARYFVGWVAALVVGSVAGLVVGALASFGRPGEIGALAVGFYAVVVVARLLGRGVARAG